MKIFKSGLKVFPHLFILFSLLSCQVKDSSNNVRPFELDEITIAEIQQGYKDGTYSIRQIVQLYMDRIEEIDKNGPKLDSIIGGTAAADTRGDRTSPRRARRRQTARGGVERP